MYKGFFIHERTSSFVFVYVTFRSASLPATHCLASPFPLDLQVSRSLLRGYRLPSLRTRKICTGTTSAINAKIMRIARAEAPG